MALARLTVVDVDRWAHPTAEDWVGGAGIRSRHVIVRAALAEACAGGG
jgi:hypothetical protein